MSEDEFSLRTLPRQFVRMRRKMLALQQRCVASQRGLSANWLLASWPDAVSRN
jgi:hypothetical protein